MSLAALSSIAIALSTGTWTRPDLGTAFPEAVMQVLRSLINFICTPICLILMVVSSIAALAIILAGLRYLAADDPGTRAQMRGLIVNVLVGMALVLLAIPIINYVIVAPLTQVSCPCMTGSLTSINGLICNFICLFATLGPAICGIMMLYGGLRYLTSSEDAGARSAARTILVNALVGLMVIMLSVPIVNIVISGIIRDVSCWCFESMDPAEQIVKVLCNFICFFSTIAPGICALVMLYGGVRWVLSGEDSGARDAAKKTLIGALVGIVIVMLAVPVLNYVMDNLPLEQVKCKCLPDLDPVKQIALILCNLICLFARVAPALSALAFIYGGVRYLVSAEDSSARSAAKKTVVASIVGLVIVLISVPVINLFLSNMLQNVACDCFDVADPAKQIAEILCSVICMLQAIAPPVAALVILYGGLKYLTSREDPGQRAAARQILLHAIIGLVIVMVAIQVVNLVVLNLLPTFECNCLNIVSSFRAAFAGSNPRLHIMSVPGTERPATSGSGSDPANQDLCPHTGEIGGKCCRVGDTECHFVYVSGDQLQHGDSSGWKITGCTPPSGPGGHYTLYLSDTSGSQSTLQPAAGAKCADKSGNPYCSSASDAATYGPTYVYEASSGVCKNYCSENVKCCQTTDSSGRPGCIGTDTGNQVRLNTCSLDDYLTHYNCVADKCEQQTTSCAGTCTNGKCNPASPDSG